MSSMKDFEIRKLEERNKKIIDAILKKADEVCPGVIELIGIAGSFQSGDFHSKSDLDLSIVVNDEKGWKMTSCFIFEDIAFDIYSTPWSRFEQMLEFKNPYSTKLMELDIVYSKNDKSKIKYLELRDKFKSKLEQRLSIEDCKNAENFVNKALLQYADVMFSTSIKKCRYSISLMLDFIEFAIYMYNKEYIKRGVKRIPEEICKMKILPLNFIESYKKIIKLEKIEKIQDISTKLMRSLKIFSKKMREEVTIKEEFSEYKNNDTYEKLSNDLNKLYHAADIGDSYLTLKTVAGIQEFFDMLYNQYNVDKIDLMKEIDLNDLKKSAKAFENVLKKYKKNYEINNIKVKRYDELDQYLNDL